jgi:cytochrome c oxidase subunit IV
MDADEAHAHDVHDPAPGAAHVLPVSLYAKVFAALLLLTGLTVTVGYLGLGAASLMVALTIAVIKAGFVIGFFMHLRYESRFLSVIFFASVMFLAIFFVLTFTDIRSRADVLEAEGNTALETDRADAARALQRARAGAVTAGKAPAASAPAPATVPAPAPSNAH